MEGLRPRTAPCRPVGQVSEFEVDTLVRDLLGGVAASAVGNTAHPRPHTACAGARAVAVVVDEHSLLVATDDSGDDSDGGDFDVFTSADLPPSRPRTGGKPPPTPSRTGERPRLAGSSASERLCFDSPARGASSARPLSREERLRHNFRRQVSTRTEVTASSPTHAVSSSSRTATASAAASMPKPQPMLSLQGTPRVAGLWKTLTPAVEMNARTLRKDCVFVDGADASKTTSASRGLATPSAARMHSHSSWAHHLPVFVRGRAADGASRTHIRPLAEATERPSSGPNGAPLAAEAPAASASSAPASTDAAAPAAGPRAPAPALQAEAAAPAQPPQAARKPGGPKFRVVPGGSRPLGPRPVQLRAPAADRVVLEFRTEPRVVPASRHGGAGGPGAAGGGERRPGAEVRAGSGGVLPFRPSSRAGGWAAEREVLAMR